MAAKVNKIGCGFIADKAKTNLKQQMEETLDDESLKAHLARAVRDLLAHEEIKGGQNLVSLIKYKLKFGDSHLINPDHSYSIRAAYDLDIKLILLTLVAFVFNNCQKMCKKCAASAKTQKKKVKAAQKESKSTKAQQRK